MEREYELYHHGVKGMKWGVRKAKPHSYSSRVVRGHSGPGRYLTRKSQLAGDKRDLERLNKGEHLSVGMTKKRQAEYDARDRQVLEKRIAKNEKYYADKAAKKQLKAEKKAAKKEYNAEKSAIMKEKLSDPKVKKAIKVGATVAATALAAYGAYKVSERIRTNDAVKQELLRRADKAGIGRNVHYKNTGNILSKNYNKGLQERLQRSGVNTTVFTSKRRTMGEIASEAAKKAASSAGDKASNVAKNAKVELDYVTANVDNLAWQAGNAAKKVAKQIKKRRN